MNRFDLKLLPWAIGAVLIAVLGCPRGPAVGQPTYGLVSEVVAAGATESRALPYRLRGTVGEPAIGPTAAPTAVVGAGFWYTVAGGGPGVPDDAPVLRAVPVPASVEPGGSFVVEIVVGDRTRPVENLHGIGFALTFDPDLVQATAAQAGDFLDPRKPGGLVWFDDLDNATGRAAVTVGRKNGFPGVPGSGVVARVRFAAVGADRTAVLRFDDVLAVDPAGHPLPLSPVGAEVDIGGDITVWPGDTNDDGTVNEVDVLPIGQHFGTTGPARADASLAWRGQPADAWYPAPATFADATGDGHVSQNDVLGISVNFGRSRAAGKRSEGSAAPLASMVLERVSADETVTVSVSMGSVEQPVFDLLGMAVRVSLPPGQVEVVSVRAGALVDVGETIGFDRFDVEAGRLVAARTRRAADGPVSGHGAVLEFDLTAIAGTAESVEVRLDELTLATPYRLVSSADPDPDARLDAVALHEGADPASSVTAVEESAGEVPSRTELLANYPNPFNPVTVIRFDLARQEYVRLAVFDVLGRKVATLVDAVRGAGRHAVRFGADTLPTGTYYYRLEAGAVRQTRPMLLVR